MQLISALLAGVIFGLGLIVSGMINPAKVQNFLDLFGSWDPSLAFVMGGAIAVTLPGFRLLRLRAKPLFAEIFSWPTRSDLDVRLFTGAAIFGVGWGLGGYCPGPAVTALSGGAGSTIVFVLAMLIGMCGAKFFQQRSGTSTSRSA
jgi:uncharacterized membrane protein YedE/YeeE